MRIEQNFLFLIMFAFKSGLARWLAKRMGFGPEGPIISTHGANQSDFQQAPCEGVEVDTQAKFFYASAYKVLPRTLPNYKTIRGCNAVAEATARMRHATHQFMLAQCSAPTYSLISSGPLSLQ